VQQLCVLQEEQRAVSWEDVYKVYHSITKEAKEVFAENKIRVAFAKYKKVSLGWYLLQVVVGNMNQFLHF